MSQYICLATSAGRKAGRLSTNTTQSVDRLSTNKANLFLMQNVEKYQTKNFHFSFFFQVPYHSQINYPREQKGQEMSLPSVALKQPQIGLNDSNDFKWCKMVLNIKHGYKWSYMVLNDSEWLPMVWTFWSYLVNFNKLGPFRSQIVKID